MNLALWQALLGIAESRRLRCSVSSVPATARHSSALTSEKEQPESPEKASHSDHSFEQPAALHQSFSSMTQNGSRSYEKIPLAVTSQATMKEKGRGGGGAHFSSRPPVIYKSQIS